MENAGNPGAEVAMEFAPFAEGKFGVRKLRGEDTLAKSRRIRSGFGPERLPAVA